MEAPSKSEAVVKWFGPPLSRLADSGTPGATGAAGLSAKSAEEAETSLLCSRVINSAREAPS